jgi:hypothetical protein
MKITDEAVQAALATLDEDDTYVSEADHLDQFVIDGPVNIKSMLTAALPFLTGLKFDPWGWVIPRGGDKKPIILEASKFDQASAAAEADIHDLGYFPIYTQPVSSPSPRAQALEEAEKDARVEALEADNKRLREALAEYIEARDAYEAATKPTGGFGTYRHLNHADPILIRYREARAALGEVKP